VGWRSPGRAETIDHRHGQSTDGDCVQALPRVSEALGRRVGLAERRRIVCLSGQNRPGRFLPGQSTRVALLSSLPPWYRPTHSESQAGRLISLNTSPPVRRRPRWSGSVVPVGGQCGCGARRLLSMALAVVTLIVKGGRSAMSDVAGLDLLPHLNEEVVDTVCVDRAALNTTSVIVPLVDRCHRSGWLPIRSGRTRVRISTRLGGGACCCPTPPSIHALIGPLIFTVAPCRTVSTGAQSPQNNRPPASAPHRADRYSFPIVLR